LSSNNYLFFSIKIEPEKKFSYRENKSQPQLIPNERKDSDYGIKGTSSYRRAKAGGDGKGESAVAASMARRFGYVCFYPSVIIR
jgi:hypothetical protein